MDLGILLLRLAVGLTFGAHGIQKLTTRLGGNGIAGTSQFVESLGFRPGRFYTYLLGLAELLGGFMIAAGVLTPIGALTVIAVMTAATVVVHRSNGFFVTNGGFEYPFVLGAAAAAIAFIGPGAYSFDALFELPVTGTLLAAEVTILGVLAGLCVSVVRDLPDKLRFRGNQARTS